MMIFWPLSNSISSTLPLRLHSTSPPQLSRAVSMRASALSACWLNSFSFMFGAYFIDLRLIIGFYIIHDDYVIYRRSGKARPRYGDHVFNYEIFDNDGFPDFVRCLYLCEFK